MRANFESSWSARCNFLKNKSQRRPIKGAKTSWSILIRLGRLNNNENKLDKDVANRKGRREERFVSVIDKGIKMEIDQFGFSFFKNKDFKIK